MALGSRTRLRTNNYLLIGLTVAILGTFFVGCKGVGTRKRTYNVGAIFGRSQQDILLPEYVGVKYGFEMLKESLQKDGEQFDFELKMKFVNDISDCSAIAKLFCDLLREDEVIAIIGPIHPLTIHTIKRLTQGYNVLYLTTSDPHGFVRDPFAPGSLPKNIIKLWPRIDRALISLVNYDHWKKVYYIYDTVEAFNRLRLIFDVSSRLGTKLSVTALRISFDKILPDIVKHIGDKSKTTDSNYIVIDAISRRPKELVMDKINNLKTFNRHNHFLIVSADSKQMNSTEVSTVGLSLMAFCPLDYSLPEVQTFYKNKWTSRDRKETYPTFTDSEADDILPYAAALMIDGLYFLKLLVKNTQPSSNRRPGQPFGDCQLRVKSRYTSVEFHHTLTKTSYTGLTGNVEFDSAGYRKNYKLNIFETRLKEPIQKLGNFSSNKSEISITRTQGPPPSKEKMKESGRITVTTIEDPPYIIVKRDAVGKIVSYEGFLVDLLDEISNLAGFKYYLKMVDDKKFGRKKNGSWTGMIGELVRNESDIALASLIVTKERAQAIDFSVPFLEIGLSLVMRKRVPSATWLGFMGPFTIFFWISVIAAMLLIGIILFFVSRFSPYEWNVNSHPGDDHRDARMSQNFTLMNCFWFVVCTVMQQGGDRTPRSASGRFVAFFWWFFVTIVVASYIANLAANLVASQMRVQILSYNDLPLQTRVKYGMVNGGSTMNFFRKSKDDTFSQMWHFMQMDDGNFMDSLKSGIERTLSDDNYAFIMESTAADYYTQLPPCQLYQVGPSFQKNRALALAFPKASDLRDKVNEAMRTLINSHKVNSLRKNWWLSKGQCPPYTVDIIDKTGGSPLTMNAYSGLFVVLIVGVILGLLVLILEFLWKSFWESRAQNRNFCDVLREMFYFGLRGQFLPLAPKKSAPNSPASAPLVDKSKDEPEQIPPSSKTGREGTTTTTLTGVVYSAKKTRANDNLADLTNV